jgi:hypothetical protein
MFGEFFFSMHLLKYVSVYFVEVDNYEIIHKLSLLIFFISNIIYCRGHIKNRKILNSALNVLVKYINIEIFFGIGGTV